MGQRSTQKGEMIGTLKQMEVGGRGVKHTSYAWKARHGGLEVSESGAVVATGG